MIILMREWSDKLYEETDGRLKVNIRVGGELPFTTSEYLDAVSNGSIQMAGCMVTAISSYLQAGGLTSVPFLVTDVESYETVMDILNPYVDEELSSYGVFNALNLFYPTQDIYGSGATPSSYKDLQGLKLRTSGAEQAKFWQVVTSPHFHRCLRGLLCIEHERHQRCYHSYHGSRDEQMV